MPADLRAWADELGYLCLPRLVAPEAAAAVRALVRTFGEARGWFLPDPDNPPRVRAVPGRERGRGDVLRSQ